MSASTQHGFLVIADISGYTSFVAKTELEHSHEILTELLELLVEKFQPLMTISKLEGDAVFAFALEGVFARGETLIDFLESMYVTFRDKQVTMRRKTTCTCNACRNIPALDLKFFVHCGDFVLQKVATIRELVGSDVNLIHRLTKNHVTESTGWRAYMLLTEACLAKLQITLADAHVQEEEYEHLGKVLTHAIDLHKRRREIIERRRLLIEERDADIVFQVDFPTPPAVAWDWIQDPDKRNQWNGGHVHWSLGDRPNGRRGVGSSNHCAHGKSRSTEVIVDWRPFDYSTAESFENGKKAFTETFRFVPLLEGGTRVYDLIVMHQPLPRAIRRAVLHLVMVKQHHFDEAFAIAARMAGEEYLKSKAE
jgi:uncharacterized protein YndB with AHSA1/START domain